MHPIIILLMFQLSCCKMRTLGNTQQFQRCVGSIGSRWRRAGRWPPQLDIPSILNCLSSVPFERDPPSTNPQSGALIALARVTPFYQKGLQLLLPHYDQQLHSPTSSWKFNTGLGKKKGAMSETMHWIMGSFFFFFLHRWLSGVCQKG